MNYFIFALIVAFILLVAWVICTHGLSGRFLYVDKRKKDVTLHLTIFGTPRKSSDARKVIDSLERCLKHLKAKGYKSATLESHLIDQKKMKTVYRIANKYGYSVKNISVFPTPGWQRFFIPFSMALIKFKIKFANPSSTKLTVFF